MRLVMVALLALSVSACSGKQAIQTTNTIKGASAEGIIDQMFRCATDALDTNNRGSGCHRGN